MSAAKRANEEQEQEEAPPPAKMARTEVSLESPRAAKLLMEVELQLDLYLQLEGSGVYKMAITPAGNEATFHPFVNLAVPGRIIQLWRKGVRLPVGKPQVLDIWCFEDVKHSLQSMQEILEGCARLPAAATAETCDDIDALVTEIASELAMCFNSQEPNDALAEAYRDEMNRLIERAHRDGVRFTESLLSDAWAKVAPPGYRQHPWERDERVPKAPETSASGQRQGFVTVDAIPNRRVDPKPRAIPMPNGVMLSWEPLTADQILARAIRRSFPVKP
jgi:hypothetical protein